MENVRVKNMLKNLRFKYYDKVRTAPGTEMDCNGNVRFPADTVGTITEIDFTDAIFTYKVSVDVDDVDYWYGEDELISLELENNILHNKVPGIIHQLESARDLVMTGKDPVSQGKAEVLSNVIKMLRTELLGEVED
jgi:hypothetical protein